MKKAGSLILAGLIFSVLMISFASAISAEELGSEVSDQIDKIINVLTPIIKPLMGNVSQVGSFSESDVLVAKILVFLLIMLIARFGISKASMFENKRGTQWAIGILVALLGIRYMGVDSLIAAILPSSVLAITATAAIPFVIYFFMVEDPKSGIKTSFMRKFLWILFAIVFLVILFSRKADLGSAASLAVWIYGLTAMAAVLLATFDGTIQKILIQHDIAKAGMAGVKEKVRFLKDQMVLIREQFVRGSVTKAELNEGISKYKQMIADLESSL